MMPDPYFPFGDYDPYFLLLEIDVYRDSVVIVTTDNDGLYGDSTGDPGRARYTYQVCEAGTQTCSNEVTITFPE